MKAVSKQYLTDVTVFSMKCDRKVKRQRNDKKMCEKCVKAFTNKIYLDIIRYIKKEVLL